MKLPAFSIKDLLQLFCVERLLPDQTRPFDRDALCAQTQRADRKRPMCRRQQTTSDVLFGRPSRIRLALHKILSPVLGSADHEVYRSKAPTLRDLHPQIDRAQSRSRIQLTRCPARGLRGLYQVPGEREWKSKALRAYQRPHARLAPSAPGAGGLWSFDAKMILRGKITRQFEGQFVRDR